MEETKLETSCSGILIVDDNEINRDICAMNLERLKVPLFFAEDGLEGLKLARKILPDLILLDIMMPKMDGFEMLRLLQEDERLQHLPVLMLTARTDTRDVVRALEGGASDYLKKPFEEEELVARVNTLLHNRLHDKRLAEDLRTGALMQQKFLTDEKIAKSLCESAGFQVAIHNYSYSSISGDFYAVSRPNPDSLVLFLGDSCGHGLPAALISMRILGSLQYTLRLCLEPDACLRQINDDIADAMPLGKFVAGCQLQFVDQHVKVCNSGQPYPILISNQTVTVLEQAGLPLGISCGAQYETRWYDFVRGDTIIIYSDGIIEAARLDGEVFGMERLIATLQETSADTDADSILEKILEDLATFLDSAPPDDDQTIIVLRKEVE